jgi:uncharacterized protein YgiB involved in biofilm formation
MKRTRTIRLVLMGMSPMILTACNPSGSGGGLQAGAEYLYPNVESCIASGAISRADCTAAFTAALEEHEQSAPQFGTREECAQQYGENGCTQTGHSSFMPFMAGMLVGRAFNTGYARPAYLGRGSQPVQGGGGNYWSGGSNPVRQPGVAPNLPPPPQGKVMTARSGFGGSTASRGG